MNRTRIEYLDYTWNPIVGCSGKGCAVREHCWAKGQAKRRKHDCQDCYDFKPHYHFDRYRQPLKVKKPSRIGVGFMGDIFDSAFSITFHTALFCIMIKASWHTFVVLTKQPQNIPKELIVPRNVWLGVSVNCKADLWRIDRLRATSAALKFVSFEPLYEDLGAVDLSGIDWVIVGAQRRPDVQPEWKWLEPLLDEAERVGAPVFLKNNLSLVALDALSIPSFQRRQEIPVVAMASTPGGSQ